jgi:predicted RNA binding protein YcfA (HicA-like mRNA interferase family)
VAESEKSLMELNRKKLVSRLEREGWRNVDGTKHDKFRHPARIGTVVVPRHRELSKGVAREIAEIAGWE